MEPLHVPLTGRFAYDLATGKWDWDDEVYRLHGLTPGTQKPTLELVLQTIHPGSRQRVADLLDQMGKTQQPFSCSYRLTGHDQIERLVFILGERAPCDDDEPSLIEGYFVDLTDEIAPEIEEATREAVHASAEHRATIEQAKGAIIMAYGVNDEAAFAMLRWWSRGKNIKVRDLAQRLVEFLSGGEVTHAEIRAEVDRIIHDLSASS